MLLDHIGQPDVATRVRDAISSTIRSGETLTGDLGGNATTREFADAVIRSFPD